MHVTKAALLIAFHYPPCVGSSGLQRTLAFSRHLPSCGWHPLVLSANPRAYVKIGSDQLSDIPVSVVVKRAFALDTARHLAVSGRYFKWMALPDRWVSWLLGGIPAGLRMIARHRPAVLWSTYPIASSHLLALVLHRITRIPWVDDFRDPMTEGELESGSHFPSDPTIWKANRWIERLSMTYCSRAVFVAPGALQMYADRYPEVGTKATLIPNGYDADSFTTAERISLRAKPLKERFVLLHSGALYAGSGDRHPGAFLSALEEMVKERVVSADRLQVVLRASGYEELYQALVQKHGLEEVVSLAPGIPYQDALAEMLAADGLLVFQGSNCNTNIPAKLYEYLRARRPIFAMVDPRGDTAKFLYQAGVGKIVPLQSKDQIKKGLLEFLEQACMGKVSVADPVTVKNYSRESRAHELAELFYSLIGPGVSQHSGTH